MSEAVKILISTIRRAEVELETMEHSCANYLERLTKAKNDRDAQRRKLDELRDALNLVRDFHGGQ